MIRGRPGILVSPNLPETVRAGLAEVGDLSECRLAPDGQFPDGPSILALEAMEPLAEAAILRLPASVGLIANLGAGVDNIDLEAARQAGIAVSNTPVVAEDTADLAMALILSASRRMTAYERLLRAGRWLESERPVHLGRSVHGKTLGIVGFGRIGQALARRARAFSMDVLYHGPNEKPIPARELQATYCEDIADLLRAADVVSLNCSLNAGTRHLLDARRLGQMKRGAVLINTGRGPLVDEDALLDALRNGRLAAAGLDVFEHEPTVPDELIALPNVTLLPHVGGATVECRRAMCARLLRNVRAFLESGHPVDRV